MKDEMVMVESGKQWVETVLTGWFPVIHAWWWRTNGDGITLCVEGSTRATQSNRFDESLLRNCGAGDEPARREARDELEALLIRSAR